MRVRLANMQVPVAVRPMFVMLMLVGVGVDPSAERQPPAEEAERNQHAAAGELPGLLEPGGNLPAEEQHERGAA